MRFDPSSPGLLYRLADNGDGMDQAGQHPAQTRPRPSPPAVPGLAIVTRLPRRLGSAPHPQLKDVISHERYP
jgi:hypothetical protein